MADKTAFDYVNEIWSIANYVRDVIRPADYNKLILPFAVLRRFECALEPTRAAVSRQAAKGVWDDDDPKYCALSGHCFYNVTSFTLSNLGATKTCDALMAYINGFSVNAREVLQRFEMRQTCEKLDEKGMLYEVCTRFSGFDLGPETVSDRMMTDIYEHLIQRYGEEISQDAEDFMTPKDVARLATAQEPREQALRDRRGPGRVDRAHLRRRARPRQVGHRPGRELHVPQGDHAAPAARCH